MIGVRANIRAAFGEYLCTGTNRSADVGVTTVGYHSEVLGTEGSRACPGVDTSDIRAGRANCFPPTFIIILL